jgi:hypothetical protein
MVMSTTRILKKNKLKLVGTKKLTLDTEMPSTFQAPPAQASVVGQEDGCVVIRVVCGCGQEINLRCAYDPGAVPAAE